MNFQRQNLSVYISLGIIVFGGLFLGFERYLDGTAYKPLEIYKQPAITDPLLATPYFVPSFLGDISGAYSVQTDKQSYAVGEDIFIILSVCHTRSITPTVQWTFVDGVVTTLVARPGQLIPVGCYTNIKVDIGKVPAELAVTPPATQYALHGSINYQVNPVRKITYLLITSNFTIKH